MKFFQNRAALSGACKHTYTFDFALFSHFFRALYVSSNQVFMTRGLFSPHFLQRKMLRQFSRNLFKISSVQYTSNTLIITAPLLFGGSTSNSVYRCCQQSLWHRTIIFGVAFLNSILSINTNSMISLLLENGTPGKLAWFFMN